MVVEYRGYDEIGKHSRLKICRYNGFPVQVRVPAPSLGLKVFTDAHDTVTVEEGDRYPLRPPSLLS
jgi:hypothetical protein